MDNITEVKDLNERAQNLIIEDMFKKPLTQKEKVYEFIKARGRVLSHELNKFGIDNCINCIGSRIRELKAEDKVWHIREDLMQSIYPHSKEIAWSIYEADKDMKQGQGVCC